jgi:predicted transcriptional regulator of viral defense system
LQFLITWNFDMKTIPTDGLANGRRTSRLREQLSTVLRASGRFVTVDSAVAALGLQRRPAAKILSSWAKQGWLKHVRRGLYAPMALDASAERFVMEDPWLLVARLFEPGYIGGWTAAEHWDLTDQIFRSTCVFTARPIRRKEQTVVGVPFVLKRIPIDAIFGTKPVWRGELRVAVSDPARTIVDMLADPAVGGGIAHVSDCLDRYLASLEAQSETVLDYADRLGNGAVFKRLGFLVSRKPQLESLAEGCAQRLTAGNAKLDPALSCPRLVKNWRLWVPTRWRAGSRRD